MQGEKPGVDATVVANKFALKEVEVVLSPCRELDGGAVTLEELERIRTGQSTLSASKYGLEAICGASCETGAQ
jgi:hypothetical protein